VGGGSFETFTLEKAGLETLVGAIEKNILDDDQMVV